MMKWPVILACVALWAAGGAQAQDAAAGEAVFKKCKSCHQVGPEAKHRTGPILNDVVGRVAGTAEGFRYRKHMVAAGEQGLVWDEATLSEYLNDPSGYLKTYLDDPSARSAMSFKLRKEQDRLDVIAYLATAVTQPAGEGDAEAAPEAESSEEEASAEPELSVEEVIAMQEFPEEYLVDQANFDAGKEFWFAQCTHCHGFKAYPGKAPKLKPVKYTPEFVFKRVYKGFKKMPDWRETFTVDEIRQIVAYVKSPDFSP